MEMKVVLKAVLSRLDVAPASGTLELTRRRAITISPGRGAETVLRERVREPQSAPVAAAA